MEKTQRPLLQATVRDPVSGMTIDPTHAHASRILGNETLSFCSERCVRQFDRDQTRSATTGVSDGGKLRRIELPVTGLNGRQGAAYLEEQLRMLPGITQVTANSKTQRVGISYDPTQTSVATIVARIRIVGYTAGLATTQIDILGLHCGSCVVTAENTLQQARGVLSATVNLATQQASIEYLPDLIDRKGLADAIEEAGYQTREVAAVPAETSVDRAEQEQAQEYSILRRKFWFAAILSLPVIVFSYPHVSSG